LGGGLAEVIDIPWRILLGLLSGFGEVDIAAESGGFLLAALFLIHIKTINLSYKIKTASEWALLEFVLEGEVDEIADLGEVLVLLERYCRCKHGVFCSFFRERIQWEWVD
jgi:hypothetical protein